MKVGRDGSVRSPITSLRGSGFSPAGATTPNPNRLRGRRNDWFERHRWSPCRPGRPNFEFVVAFAIRIGPSEQILERECDTILVIDHRKGFAVGRGRGDRSVNPALGEYSVKVFPS